MLVVLCFSSKSYAALNIQITSGVRAPLPIAIVPFAGQVEPTDAVDINQGKMATNYYRDYC